MIAALLTPAQRLPPPALAARVCMNGHLVERTVPLTTADLIDVNRADPLAVRTTAVRCPVCSAGTIVGCPGCGYAIPADRPGLAYEVPHFCIVCGEFYPWTFRGEFYATLAEILDEAPELADAERGAALRRLGRLREGLATGPEVGALAATFAGLGGSDAELAAEILAVVLPEGLRPQPLRDTRPLA